MCKGRLKYAQAPVLVLAVFIKVPNCRFDKVLHSHRFFSINLSLLDVTVLLSYLK